MTSLYFFVVGLAVSATSAASLPALANGSLRPRRAPPLAYASVGKSGDFGGTSAAGDDGTGAQTYTFGLGLGWLYGLGVCIGPFFGVGVGLTFPGGILAGAGGGVGIMFGIGFGSGLVWGGGRGVVQGFGVTPPMKPPFLSGDNLPRDLPSLKQLLAAAAEAAEEYRQRAADKASEFMAERRMRRGEF